jgi:peptidoglycan hydrolase FlgJ
MDAGVQSAMALAQQAPLAGPPRRVGESQSGNQTRPTAIASKADTAAKDYEAVFISQFLGSMFSGIKSDGITGGGEGEEMFRSLMVDQYAKGMQQRGGFGIAAQMKAELLKHQQVSP